MRHWLLGAGLGGRDMLTFARGVEEAGYTGIVLCDQLFFPEVFETRYHGTESGEVSWSASTPFPDPWCAISAMAAVTTTLELGTFIYIAPLRSVFTVAKAVATAAVIAEGRVFFGAGAGWNREQFEVEGIDFASRGRRMEEMLEALPLLWSGDVVRFDGEHVRFPELSISPTPAQPIRTMLGGDSPIAMARAARLADGWLGRSYDLPRSVQLVREMHVLLERHGRDPAAFEIVLGVEGDATVEKVEELEAAGATGVLLFPGARRPRAVALAEASYFEHSGSATIEAYLETVRALADRLGLR